MLYLTIDYAGLCQDGDWYTRLGHQMTTLEDGKDGLFRVTASISFSLSIIPPPPLFLNIVRQSRDQRTKISASVCPGWFPCQQCYPKNIIIVELTLLLKCGTSKKLGVCIIW